MRRLSLVPTLLVLTAIGAGAQAPRPRELAFVKELGAALAEYHDGSLQAVVAYYHAQRHHDSRWLLLELGLNSQRGTSFRRDRIELHTPDGEIVPLSGQRRWSQDPARAQRLLQQVQPSRHQVRSYFRMLADVERLRFFSAPNSGGTVIDAVDTGADRVLLGDLLFESPTGAWERGRHVLVIGHTHGVAELPIDLR